MSMPVMRARSGIRPNGFTLVEILIVVVILGILAAIVIPQFTSATQQSRINSLKTNLHRIRQQIQIYKQEHDGWPTLADFQAQMTGESNSEIGEGSEADRATLAPYLQGIPVNPMNGMSNVNADKSAESGWYYDEDSGEFLANDSAASRQY